MMNSHDEFVRISRLLRNPQNSLGFTLLEVLIGITLLAIGATIALSLISGSLRNIRKVQSRIIIVEHANAVMELTLLDESIKEPRTFSGDFVDGTRWSVRIEDYESPAPKSSQLPESQAMPGKLLRYSVDMFYPHSNSVDYQLQSLKLLRVAQENQPARSPQ
jgi:prepilin-type N-terminal cleavage/methylation domain-containing protein